MFTNTAPVDAYRGAGRPEATYLVERLVETAARETGHRPGRDPPAQLHQELPVRRRRSALTYDTGDYDATHDEARWSSPTSAASKRARRRAKRKGKLRGIGYSAYIEACGIAPSNIAGALGARAGLFEAGEVRVHPTGKVTVFTGSTATARATRRPSRRWSPTGWASR